MKRLIFAFVLIFELVSAFAQANSRPDALVLYRNRRYREAIEICEAELKEDSSRLESYVVLTWALIGNKQYAEASQRASDGLKISPYDLRLTEALGEAYYYLGNNKLAMEQFQRYVAKSPDSGARVGTSYYYMGEIYVRQHRYQHADIAFSAAVKKEPLLDTWWVRLGWAREQAGNYYEALEAYDEALVLNSSSVDARQGRDRVSAKLR